VDFLLRRCQTCVQLLKILMRTACINNEIIFNQQFRLKLVLELILPVGALPQKDRASERVALCQLISCQLLLKCNVRMTLNVMSLKLTGIAAIRQVVYYKRTSLAVCSNKVSIPHGSTDTTTLIVYVVDYDPETRPPVAIIHSRLHMLRALSDSYVNLTQLTRAKFPKVWELERSQRANVTFKAVQGR